MTDLRIRGLCKAFGAQEVLRGLDLDVSAGELVAILGASGSGKTTLLRLIGGFERIDAGTVRIGDVIVSGPGVHVPPERRRISYVAQDGALFPHLLVADNITFGLPWRRRRARDRVDELLDLVGLPRSFAGRRPQELSSGEQQRVALARALAPAPAFVLLDEPFSSLDAALRAETRAATAAALSTAGATALLVTHDQGEALSMGHRVAVLRDGHLVQIAAPLELYRHPVDPELARFVGEAVMIRGTAAGGRVISPLGALRLAGDVCEGAVDVLVRPEQIKVVPIDGGEGDRDGQGVRAKVGKITYYGHDADVRLRLTGTMPLTLVARVPGHQIPRPGDEVMLVVDGEVVAYRRPASH
jgi:iron(III) transport system ATP-binding protein